MGSISALKRGVTRFSVAHFLIALTLWLLTVPFLIDLPDGELIGASLITVVLLLAVTAVGGRRRSLFVAALLVTPALLTIWVDHFRSGAIPKEVSLVAAMVFMSYVGLHLLMFIVRAPRVNSEVLCAAMASFLMLGVVWAFAYQLVAMKVPNSFVFTVASEGRSMTAFEAFYFSFGSLTAYYGDIVPVSRAARTLAMAESTAGLLFTAVLIARLVAAYAGDRDAESPP